jgi:PAS domain S-box-containing protein
MSPHPALDDLLPLVARLTRNSVLITDAERRILWANQAFTDLTGYTLKEVLGKVPGHFLQCQQTDQETIATMRCSLHEGRPHVATLLNRGKNGNLYWVETDIQPVRGPDGRVNFFVAIQQNVTARINQLNKLETNRLFLARIGEVSGVGAWELDLETETCLWSDQTAAIHGCPPGFRPSLEEGLRFYTEESRPVITKAVETSIANGQGFDLELTIRTRQGDLRWVRAVAETVMKDAKVARFFGTFQDITESIRIRTQLQAERDFKESLIAHMRGGFAIFAPDGTQTDVNPALCAMTGFTKDELVGRKPPHPYWDPEAPDLLKAAFHRILAGHFEIRELPFVRKNGQRFWAEFSPSCNRDEKGAITSFFAVVTDISDRRLAQDKLAESEALFRTLADSAPVLIWMSGVDKTRRYFNRCWLEFTGRSTEQERGEGWTRGVHPDDLGRCAHICHSHVDQRRPFSIDYRLRRRDGVYRWITDNGVPRFDKDGDFLGFIGSCIDITERMEATERLRQSETGLILERRRLTNILEGTNVGTWEWNVQSGETIFNDRWAEIIGCKLSEISPVTFDTWLGFVHPDDIELSGARIRDHLQGRTDYYECECRMRHKDGRWIWVLDRGRISEVDAAGKPLWMAGTHQDITDRKQVEERLRLGDDLLKKISAQVPGTIYQFQRLPDGRLSFPFASENMREIYGVEPADVRLDAGKVMQRIDPRDQERVLASVAESAARLQPWHCDYRVVLPRKGLRWLRGSANPEKLPDGSTLWHGYIADVTENKRAETALMEKTEELDRYFNYSLDLLCIADNAGRFLRLNPLWETALGHPVGSLLGRRFIDYVHPDDVPTTLAAMSALQSGSDLLNFENRYRAADGSYRSIEWRSRLVGKHIYAVARDVTDRRLAEDKIREQARILGFILEDVLAGYWDWDVAANREYYSPKMLKVLGRDTGPAPETPEAWQRWIHPDDLPLVLERFHRHEATRGEIPYSNEVRYRKPDGSIIWVLCVGQIIEWTPAGKARRMIGVHLDISESRLVQIDLHQANRKLEETIVEANRLRAKAEDANRAKSAFLATMSHEIRTPMNAVIGMTTLLDDTPLDGQQKDFVSTIKTSGEALLALINDILDFSKIEAGVMMIETVVFNLEDCLLDTLEMMAVKARQKNIELAYFIEPGCPRALRGDVNRLRQILVNLLSNALKFTERGEVRLRVASRAGRDGRWIVRCDISDTGIGIDADALARLFQPFTQADSSITRRFGGTGLGLTICKRLAEAMGGSVFARSQPGAGSTFGFEIEFEGAEIPSMASADPLPEKLRGASIFAVDDNATNREFLEQQLALLGMRARIYPSAAEALAALGDSRPDLVLTDLLMPAIDGVAFARSLRDMLGALAPPIILACSSDFPVEPSVRGLFHGLLGKPFKPRLLAEKLADALADRSPGKADTKSAADPLFEPRLASRCPLAILVVEDSPVNQKVIGHMLGRMGYHPLFSGDGVECLETWRRQPVDLIFMDIQMPRMGGIEASELIRSERGVSPQPFIVALTAGVLLEDKEACIKAGMDAYLMKPVEVRSLTEIIKETHRLKTERDASRVD